MYPSPYPYRLSVDAHPPTEPQTTDAPPNTHEASSTEAPPPQPFTYLYLFLYPLRYPYGHLSYAFYGVPCSYTPLYGAPSMSLPSIVLLSHMVFVIFFVLP